MEEKLQKLYFDCINELKSINIDILNSRIGTIDIKIASRNSKRYGCCKQEEPDITTKHVEKRGRKRIIQYEKYNKHHIEISKWVMELDDYIIKNTIIHEIIHCLPKCNNHGTEFKRYANYINKNLNYNITRLGNKSEDYKKSNIEYNEDIEKYNYRVVCKKCEQAFYRVRIQRNFANRYLCAKCGGRFDVYKIIK